MTELDPSKGKIIKIRGKTIQVLPFIRMPKIFFHPDTPKKVVWLDPT